MIMQDFAGNELKVGQVVIVKPTKRHSEMKFGVVQKLYDGSAKIVTGAYKLNYTGGRCTSQSIYLVQSEPKQYNCDDELILELPEGFPEELVPIVAELNE